MTPIHVDVAIIGAGTAGMGAYRAARAQSGSVLLIEAGAYGTTCARVGCMPSKLLIAAAEAAHRARHADPFGVRVLGLSVDGAAVMDRVRHERDRFVGFVLAATGRAPNLAGLALKNTGLELDDRGVPLFDRYTLQCGSSSIFIAGDASNEIPLLHEAADQGRIAGENAGRFPDIRSGLRRTPLSVVFTEPQVASVGVNLEQIKRRFEGRCAEGRVSFEDQGRSRVMLRNKGILKVYAERGSGLFLGAEMFGPAAEHIGHLLAWAAQQRMTVAAMLEMPFYHPVIEEGLRTALRDLQHNLQKAPEPVAHCMDCGPGA